MSAYDVVVVGGGIGGLTVAALLSARGLNTCLLERQSQVGGCIARVEFSYKANQDDHQRSQPFKVIAKHANVLN